MKFKATNDQLKQIIFNAIEVSHPLGFGCFSYRPELEFKAEDLKLNKECLIYDYVCGRWVKLFIFEVGVDCYEIENEPIGEYQTWIGTYPTNEALVTSVIDKKDCVDSL